MATAYNIEVTPGDYTGALRGGPRADSAEKVNQLLQVDLKTHDIYFNEKGFHNHIVHHLLTDFVFGASPTELLHSYQRNSSYQRSLRPIDDGVVKTIQDRKGFRECLGQRSKYPQYLIHFQMEVEFRGVEDVLQEYVFSGTDLADNMFARLFAGFSHPWIHLGFGLEFNQPAIVAQALAEAATHADNELLKFLLSAEYKANQHRELQSTPIVEIQKEIFKSRQARYAVEWKDEDKIKSLVRRVHGEMLYYTSQFRVNENDLQEKMAEIMNAAAFAMGASQKEDKPIKFDFYYLHCVTSNIFLSTFLDLPYLSQFNKARLLEWKARADLVLYASRRPPEPKPQFVSNYPAKRSWEELASATITHPKEDGHASKILRSLLHGRDVCKPYYDKKQFLIKEDMWLRLGNMCVDSIYPPGPMAQRWVFGCGFEDAWTDIPPKLD